MRQIFNIIAGAILLMVLSTVNPFTVEARQKIILFDEGHGQKFLVGGKSPLDLSGLSELFTHEGLQVETNKGEITEKVLAGVDALVISGAFAPFTQAEMSAIIDFVSNGGNLCIMLHIGFPVAHLLSKLKVYVSKGVVHENENILLQNEVDFYVTPSAQHELMKGIERFKVFGGWALVTNNQNAEVIAQTSPKAWMDTNMNTKRDPGEKQRQLGLAVAGTLGDGSFVVFGDDAIFQNRFLAEENIQLGKNLTKWLGGGKSATPSDQVYL